jgi:hypothetical protein
MIDVLHRVERLMSNNVDLCLEKVGEKVLEYAHENASQGYRSVPYSGNDAIVWPQRDEFTDALYRASPYHQEGLTGLTTGRDKLIESLERGGNDNIFETGHREIEVGTRFRHAALLEKGGVRHMTPNIGFTEGGAPRKWLIEAMAAGLISPEEVNEIRSKFSQPRYVPSRPFLWPAIAHLRDNQQHTGICATTLLGEMHIDLSLDRVRVKSGDGIIVYE